MSDRGYYQKRIIWSIAGGLLALGAVVLSLYRVWQGNTQSHLVSLSGLILGFFFVVYNKKCNPLGILGVLLLVIASGAIAEVNCNIITSGGFLSRFVDDIRNFAPESFFASLTFFLQVVVLLVVAVLFSSFFLYCGKRKALVVMLCLAVGLRLFEISRIYFIFPVEDSSLRNGYLLDAISVLSLEIALLLFVAGVKRLRGRDEINYNMYNLGYNDITTGVEEKEKEWRSKDIHSGVYDTGFDYSVPVPPRVEH